MSYFASAEDEVAPLARARYVSGFIAYTLRRQTSVGSGGTMVDSRMGRTSSLDTSSEGATGAGGTRSTRYSDATAIGFARFEQPGVAALASALSAMVHSLD